MPRGTCKICGCSDDHACEDGCWWVDEERTVCSQCVCWVVTNDSGVSAIHEGVFPYNVVPVRNAVPEPAWNHHTGQVMPVLWLDLRRVDEETRERLHLPIAQINGGTVEDIVRDMLAGKRFPIDARCVAFGFTAESLEEAGARAEEIRTTGRAAGTSENVIVQAVIEPEKGGTRRG